MSTITPIASASGASGVIEQPRHDPAKALPPPLRLETGAIVTLRMRGHSRTAGLEYFAPAVVLAQHLPAGEIEVLVWDATAGTHYNPAYQIRDVGVRGGGGERELYELQSNIGAVLFSPERFSELMGDVESMSAELLKHRQVIGLLEQRVAKLEGSKPVQPPVDKK